MNNSLENMFYDIQGYDEWTSITQINKGWSRDKKYFIKNTSGEKFLLRIADFEFYDKKKKEFDSMKNVYKIGINMSKPIDFGMCGAGEYVYSLLSWVDGVSVNEIIQTLSDREQYDLGIKAGQMLKKMHKVPVTKKVEDWEKRMTKKIEKHLSNYKSCGFKVENDEFAISHIKNNMHLLKGRIQKYQHGDFHVGNLILSENGELGVIDFNRWDYGDVVEEFYKVLLFNRQLSIPFSIGQINGYFDDNIPDDFFPLLSLYIADVILGSVAWAVPFGIEDVNGMIERARVILDDYDNFKRVVPKWFDKDLFKDK